MGELEKLRSLIRFVSTSPFAKASVIVPEHNVPRSSSSVLSDIRHGGEINLLLSDCSLNSELAGIMQNHGSNVLIFHFSPFSILNFHSVHFYYFLLSIF